MTQVQADAPAGTNYMKVEIDDQTYVAESAEIGQMAILYGATRNQTPSVQYGYDESDGHDRLVSMTYPDGRVLHYGYTSGIDDAISRLSYLADDDGHGGVGQHLEELSYLGDGTVVVRNHPEDGIALTYKAQSGDLSVNTDGGDQYTGLDRFGRVIDQNQVDTATGDSVDRYQYSYDRNGNVIAKLNLLNSSLDESYSYDDLDRLTDDAINGTANQSWDLDAVGNMNSVTTGGTTEDRTTNSQNELTQVGANTLTYDANGNTLTDDQGHTLVYDAWNRLAAVHDDLGNPIESYSYDGTGRRIHINSAYGPGTDLYYSENWQVLEERQGVTVTAQYVWSPVYVNALILTDRNADYNRGTGGLGIVGSGLEERDYSQQDANYNVTSVVTSNGSTWSVAQREVYTSYGMVSFYTSDWVAATNTLNAKYLYQDGLYDANTGLYIFQHRDYSPTMMRWDEVDPMGYVDGMNSHQFVQSNPIYITDPTGFWGDGYTNSTENGASMGPPGQFTYTNPPPDPGYIPVEDIGGIMTAEQWLLGNGTPLRITGDDFINNVKSSPVLQSYIGEFKEQVLMLVRKAGASLKCDETTHVPFSRQFNSANSSGFEMPGIRWLGFGTVYVNMSVDLKVKKVSSNKITYAGIIHYRGYDRYQWGTARSAYSSSNPIGWAVRAVTSMGTPYNVFWEWNEPWSGSVILK